MAQNPFSAFQAGDPRAALFQNATPAPMPHVTGPLPTQRGTFQDVRSDPLVGTQPNARDVRPDPYINSYRSPTAFGSTKLGFDTEWTLDPATGEFIFNPTSEATAAEEIRALMDLRTQLDAQRAQRQSAAMEQLQQALLFAANGGTLGGGPQSPMQAVSRASGQFGFAPGQVPGGDAISFLRSQGLPVPDFLQQTASGQPVRPGSLGTAAQELGGVSLPSLQGLRNLNPDELEFLAGFFETVLGIPFQTVINEIQRPFAGLQPAAAAR